MLPAAPRLAHPVAEIDGLGKRYGDAWAVRGLQFQLRGGEVFGFVGANGAGKTTALKMLAGLVAPTEGAARVHGRDVQTPEHRARVGYLPEESALYDELTPRAYLRFFADLYGVERSVAQQRIAHWTEMLRLDARPGQRIGDLSKGTKRKVAIARSLINDPEFLLFDEPASGLDPVVSAAILDMVDELRRAGKTVVLSAHNLFHVERICDRVLILHRGEVVALGTMDEIRAASGGMTYRVRLSVQVDGAQPVEGGFEAVVGDFASVQALEREAVARGGRLLGVASRELSLEDIFLRRAR